VDWKAALERIDAGVENAQRGLRRFLGRRLEPRPVAYRGWVAGGRAVVLGRVIEDDRDALARLRRAPRLARVAYERFATLGLAGARVRVGWGGQTLHAASGAGGFVDVALPAAETPAATTEASIEMVPDDGMPAAGGTARAEVFAIQPQASLGIISDIDDTVLETELENPVGRALQLVYSRDKMRLPFDGIAALYQAFTAPGNPVFYVSNAPWSLYHHVVELLDHHAIPRGPLLLRDQGVVVERASRLGGVHKRVALKRIVEDCPWMSFVLLGDSSRRDPLRYVEVAEEHPGRVAAIYIRAVSGLLARREDLDLLKARANRVGVELLVATDTVTIARHAASRGLVPRTEVGHVAEGKREDEQAPSLDARKLAE
jgi:phosphatidate phosphatase APP1